METSRGAKIGLIVVILVALGAAGWYFLDLNPGPDRTDLIREHLLKSEIEADRLQMVSVKQVRARVIDRIRKEHPTFEVVNGTFLIRDSQGNNITNTWQFWILDGKVIKDDGRFFQDDGNPDSETKIRYQIAQKTDPSEARRIKEEMAKRDNPEGESIKGGPPWAGKGKGKGQGARGNKIKEDQGDKGEKEPK